MMRRVGEIAPKVLDTVARSGHSRPGCVALMSQPAPDPQISPCHFGRIAPWGPGRPLSSIANPQGVALGSLGCARSCRLSKARTLGICPLYRAIVREATPSWNPIARVPEHRPRR